MAGKENHPTDFNRRLIWARECEVAIGDFLRARNWWAIPSYDFSDKGDDKAPKMLAPRGRFDLVLPDLQCFRDGKQRWFEIKRKTRSDHYRIGGYAVTGMSLRLFEHYRRIEKETKSDVVIVFVHETEGEVRGDTLSNLEKLAKSHRYDGDAMGRAGMIFWRYEQIQRWSAWPLTAEPAIEAVA